MSGLELLPFSEEHLDDAGVLLAERHALQRRVEPLLPARFEDPAEARGEVAALARAEGASGAVAIREGRVVAFLVGVRKPDEIWGANVWVEAAGHAAEDAEVLRDLYAEAARRWVEEGRTRHYAVVPATDGALVDAWFRLCFGQQQALAIRELPDDVAWPEAVREADARDVEELVRLAPYLADHQAASPVFSGRAFDEDEDSLRREIEEDIESPTVGCLVAERNGRLVGSFIVYPLEVSSMHTGPARPDAVSFLGWAATEPGVRGSGAGLALTHACFSWARSQGYVAMVTDWRVTNLLSSRFWPRRGFRTTFLRLYRSIP